MIKIIVLMFLICPFAFASTPQVPKVTIEACTSTAVIHTEDGVVCDKWRYHLFSRDECLSITSVESYLTARYGDIKRICNVLQVHRQLTVSFELDTPKQRRCLGGHSTGFPDMDAVLNQTAGCLLFSEE